MTPLAFPYPASTAGGRRDCPCQGGHIQDGGNAGGKQSCGCRDVPWPRLPGAVKPALLRPPNPYVHLMGHAWPPASFHLVGMASAPPLCRSTGRLRHNNGGVAGGQGMGGPSPLETQSMEDEMLVENEV